MAVLLGLAVGWLVPKAGGYVSWIGEIFTRLIRMVVVPLVLVTITTGIASLGSIRKLGLVGVRAIVLFVCLSILAACAGIGLALALQPGHGARMPRIPTVAGVADKTLSEQLLSIIPTNPFFALVNGDMLAVIFFAILVGVGILCAGDVARPIKDLIAAASAVMLKIVIGVMELAPFGVFALIVVALEKSSSLTFMNVSLLGLGVLLGSTFETIIIHGALIRFVAQLPVFRFFTGASDALLMAFSTGSSSATLPAAIAISERNFGIGNSVSSTVLPLGASIGRDGTAMYVSLLAVFSAQVFEVPLTLQDYIRIVLTTSLVALSTAPVPSASLFMLAAVLSAIGIDGTRTAWIVGVILPFDSFFNMVRTVPNVTSNLTVAVTTAKLGGDIDVGIFCEAPRSRRVGPK